MRFFPVLIPLLLLASFLQAQTWKPVPGHMMTRWAAEVRPDNAWKEYPRPQMQRKEWLNLNGLWEYSIAPKTTSRPANMDGHILVPFAVESALSGVKKPLLPDQRLWYRRTFRVPAGWNGQRVLLRFEAVDFETFVWVNGGLAGSHRGGYDPFHFDITAYLKSTGDQEVVVAVTDPTSDEDQPRGKQTLHPARIWYTPVSGIWQTVWLEPVAKEAAIGELRIRPDVDHGEVKIAVISEQEGLSDEYAVRVTALDGGRKVSEAVGRIQRELTLPLANAKLWSPDQPFLYDLKVELFRVGDPFANLQGNQVPRRGGFAEQAAYKIGPSDQPIDSVDSYFGMRKISLGPGPFGPSLFLNNQALFQYGTLDQGYWPDGLYTPPTDAAMRYDLEFLKSAGFNMLRKHIKVEPARYYYHCDKMGILVWQDMPSGMFQGAGRLKDRATPQHVREADEAEILRRSPAAQQFELELRRMIDARYNSPAIVMWVVLNEGWGQYDTARLARLVKDHDPTRLVNAISGWKDIPAGDVMDLHSYEPDVAPRSGVYLPDPDRQRASVIGEFGGLGHPVQGHLWAPDAKGNWGYQSYTDMEEYKRQYQERLKHVIDYRDHKGVSAAVYTQTTDVEQEINGLLTYDREEKIPPAQLKQYAMPLYGK